MSSQFPDPQQQVTLSELASALQTAMLLVSRLDVTAEATLTEVRAAYAALHRASTAAHALRPVKE